MDPKVQIIMEKTAAYIAEVQPRLDAENERRLQFAKRAMQAAGVLARRGIIAQDAVNKFVDKVASSEDEVWSLVEKLAESIQPDVMMDAVAEKLASGEALGPWEKLYYFGDARADTRRPGMVD